MQIAHLGHAAVLVETDAVRILIDPGNFSDDWHGLTDLDAVLVTHQHPDHLDPEHVPALLATNPQARVLVEPSVLEGSRSGKLPPLPDGAAALGEEDQAAVGDVLITSGMDGVYPAGLAVAKVVKVEKTKKRKHDEDETAEEKAERKRKKKEEKAAKKAKKEKRKSKAAESDSDSD